MSKKMSNLIRKGMGSLALTLLSGAVFAEDLLKASMDGDVKDTFGSDAKFWTIFIIIDIALSTAAAVKAKNPLVFAGVFFTAFIPGILLKAFVFG